MPRQLHLLAWDRPLLDRAVDHLTQGWNGGALDLRDVLIVVPTRQSGRRLREALAVRAAEGRGAVLAPRVVTPEQLLQLAVTERNGATRVQALLAWVRVLRAIEAPSFPALFPHELPARSLAWAAQLAENLLRLQGELAEGGHRLADVSRRVGADFPERERWEDLARLEAAYDTELQAAGVVAAEVGKIAAARNPAAPPAGVARVVLLGLADPVPLVFGVIEAWSQQVAVEVLAYGPRGGEARFDEWGRPRTAEWSEAPVELPDFDGRCHPCSDPADQGGRLARWAEAYRERRGALAFGCGDPELLPVIAGEMEAAGMVAYLPEGRPLARHPLLVLLRAWQRLAREDSYAALAALVRAPEVLSWLARKAGPDWAADTFLRELDATRDRHLCATPAELHARLRPGASARALELIVTAAAAWRKGPFPDTWQATLGEIHADREIDPARPAHREFAAAAQAWRESAEAVARAGAGLDPLDAGEIALRLAAAGMLPQDKPPGAFEIDGWLELLFRSEPHLIVAGCNDGVLPKAVTGHAYLPESLRSALGLATNADRLAREAWQLAALVASRAEGGRVDLLFGQVDASGDPLRPSRLLLLCDDAQLAARVRRVFRPLPPAAGHPAWRRAWPLRPPWVDGPPTLRVTGFRDYLRCPFRFYLRHVLEMERFDAGKTELAASDFGTLVHQVLEQIGRKPDWRDCTDGEELGRALVAEFDRKAAERYGENLALPILVQFDSARQRLARAARVQAAERADGWVIQEVEWKFPEGRLQLAGIPIRGTIDRIERHEADGRWRVLDYKTSESGKGPQDAHLAKSREAGRIAAALVQVDGRGRRWIDLQLPLYRWALREVFGAEDAAIGYFTLPRAVTETRVLVWADYDAGLHAAAMACAQEVAAAVAARRYWPPVEEVDNDEFADLIHDGAAASFDVSGWPADKGATA